MAGLVGSTVSDEYNQEGTHELLGMPEWAGYTFGSLFIVIGLLLFTYYPKAKRNADKYRKEQLIEFNKQKKRNVLDYKQTGMFLPAWEKAKLFAPVLFGSVLIIMGIAWIAGQTLFSM